MCKVVDFPSSVNPLAQFDAAIGVLRAVVVEGRLGTGSKKKQNYMQLFWKAELGPSTYIMDSCPH